MPHSVHLQYLGSQRNHLTFRLAEWLIDQYEVETAMTLSKQQAARLQCWVNLLVNTLLESLRLNQTELLGDYMVVLQEREPELFKPSLWQIGLSRLGCDCHRLLKNHFTPLRPLERPRPKSIEAEAENNLIERYEELAHCLTCLDLALVTGQKELDRLQSSKQCWIVVSAGHPAYKYN